MLEYVKNFNSDRKTFQDEVKNYLKDTTVSLDKRWETFLICDSLLDVKGWISESMELISECIYDDFYLEKEEVISFIEIYERITEGITAQGEIPDKFTQKFDIMYSKLDEWCELVLQEGYSGFTNSW